MKIVCLLVYYWLRDDSCGSTIEEDKTEYSHECNEAEQEKPC